MDEEFRGTVIVGATITDKAGGQPVPARVYVTGSDGKPYFGEAGQIFSRAEEQHFLADGSFEVHVPPGKTVIRVERGPEFLPATTTTDFTGGWEHIDLAIGRWINMAAEGWYSADLHVHRDPDDIPLALLAEDLNLVPLLTSHAHVNSLRQIWKDDRPAPPDWLFAVDDTHVYSVFDHELERLGPNHAGAALFLGLQAPFLDDQPGPLWPSDQHYLEEAIRRGAHIDAEKPFWRGAPGNVALGLIDSMGVVCNHLHRQKMMTEAEGYGALARGPEYRPDNGRDFVLWVMDLYYRYLNCGFRIPISAGTASGIMPSPIGYNRVYAKPEGPFSYESWFKALRAGRSFATNGPMMRFSVNGKEAGAELSLSGGDGGGNVEVEAMSAAPLEKLEIVWNGEVVASMAGDGQARSLQLKKNLIFEKSGWVAARAFEFCPFTERCAHTSPVYITVDRRPVADKKAAEYFLEVLAETIRHARTTKEFKSEEERSEALKSHEKALAVFAKIAVSAGK